MLENILVRYPKEQSSLVMILQDVQSEYGYLPGDVLENIAAHLSLPKASVFSVATFYRVFSLQPQGKKMVKVCLGTACHVKQGNLILESAERILSIEKGQTTPDGNFTLQSVGCVGACAIGPVVEINDHQYGNVTVPKLTKLLKEDQ